VPEPLWLALSLATPSARQLGKERRQLQAEGDERIQAIAAEKKSLAVREPRGPGDLPQEPSAKRTADYRPKNWHRVLGLDRAKRTASLAGRYSKTRWMAR
jgi:hypothetical protein